MDRRQFLIRSGIIACGLFSSKVWALPQSAGAGLLVVLLRGGYDGASLLVPHGFPFYYASRPNIAIAAPDPANPNAAIDIGQGYGLHPAASSLHALYRTGQAVLVPFSGSADLSRSHFQSQDVMELGLPPSDHPDYSSGFLNRLVAALRQDGRQSGGMSFTGNPALAFRGHVDIPNISLKTEVRGMLDERQTNLLTDLYRGETLERYVEEGIRVRRDVFARLENEMKDASRGASMAQGFEKEARSIAVLMRDNPAYSIGFADLGGWDTHVNQGAASGPLAGNLLNLSRGLAGFADELGPDAWRRTIVVVMSEFGRTFRENGDRGTDHGHGNTLWVLGGGISGGRLAGEMTGLSEKSLFQNRDLPVLNDYRSVLADLMRRMYGLDPSSLRKVFPGVSVRDYGML